MYNPLRLPENLQIEYRNQSRDPKTTVVVATRNVSAQGEDEDKLVAWKVLATQTKIFFQYPRATEVGAFYTYDHEVITCGPFKAPPGSTWKIMQDSVHEAPLLLEGM